MIKDELTHVSMNSSTIADTQHYYDFRRAGVANFFNITDYTNPVDAVITQRPALSNEKSDILT